MHVCANDPESRGGRGDCGLTGTATTARMFSVRPLRCAGQPGCGGQGGPRSAPEWSRVGRLRSPPAAWWRPPAGRARTAFSRASLIRSSRGCGPIDADRGREDGPLDCRLPRPASRRSPGAAGAPATRRTERPPPAPGWSTACSRPSREQHRPARQAATAAPQVELRHEALLDEERQEVVAAAGGAGPGDRPGRLDHQRRAQVVLDEDQTAGDAEHRLPGAAFGAARRRPGRRRRPAASGRRCCGRRPATAPR